MSKKATIQTIGQSDNVGLYSICFDGKEENEFREFLHKFRDSLFRKYIYFASFL